LWNDLIYAEVDAYKRTLNARLALQYVDYFTFNGTSANARDNNNLYLSASTALKF